MYQTNGATYPDDYWMMRDLTLARKEEGCMRRSREVGTQPYLIVYWSTVQFWGLPQGRLGQLV